VVGGGSGLVGGLEVDGDSSVIGNIITEEDFNNI